MQIGIIGLGKMGANMAQRLMNCGHECFAYDLNEENVHELVAHGAQGCSSLENLAQRMSSPRVIWVMVPAGEPTDRTITALAAVLDRGDIIIDGGNSFYQDGIQRAKALALKGIHFLDVGTSGGVFGKDRGYCLMIGGDTKLVDYCTPLFRSLAPGVGALEKTPGRKSQNTTSEEGFFHCGPTGAGHFVKMVHNGIEYGLMQAYAEGFDILRGAAKDHIPIERRYNLDVGEISELWRRGSVIGSWLLDLTAKALAQDQELSTFSGHIEDSGEGRWTVNAAVEQGVSAEVLTTSLYKRFRSRERASFAEKIISAMRFQFGGHREKK